MSNFGTFAAPDRRLVLGLNDFDKTLPGPFEWDVKRLVASFAVAGRDRGFDNKQRKLTNMAVARSYRQGMLELAQMRKLDIWYSRLDIDELDTMVAARMRPGQVKRFRKNVAIARAREGMAGRLLGPLRCARRR